MKIHSFSLLRCIGISVTILLMGFHPYSHDKNLLIWHSIRLSAFTRINIQGSVKLDITGSTNHQDTLMYANKLPPKITIQVKNHTLLIQNQAQRRPSTPWIQLSTHQLSQLYLTGPAQIHFHHMNPHIPLALITRGLGPIHLYGHIPLHTLIKHGPGYLSATWVDTKDLHLTSQAGHIKLAGIAQHLYSRLSGSSVLNAKYLRSKTIWIDAKNHSMASVLPINCLNAFANNDAIIDYYKKPKQLFAHTQHHGRIMPIAQWR